MLNKKNHTIFFAKAQAQIKNIFIYQLNFFIFDLKHHKVESALNIQSYRN